MPASKRELISTQTRSGTGLSTVHLEEASQWGGPPGKRAYVKRQSDYYCRPAWRLWRRTALVTREHRALRACQALGINVPPILHYQAIGNQATLVVEELADTVPLDSALHEFPARRTLILDTLGRALSRLHGAGWYHGALYAHHILVGHSPESNVWLIDFEKARRSRRRRREDLRRLWRHNRYLSAEDRNAVMSGYRARN